MLIIRYLSSELFKTTLAVLVFLFLVVLSNRLVWVLADAGAGEFGREAIWIILALQIPRFLSLIIPVGFAFAILLTLNRLSVHNEMDILYVSGLSQREIVRRLFELSLIISILTGIFSLWLSPWAVAYQEKLKVEHAHTISKSLINPGRFQQVLGRSEWVVYVEKLSNDERELNRILLLKATSKKEKNNETEVLMAEKGYFAKEQTEAGKNRYLKLENGYRYEGVPGDRAMRFTQFETLLIPIKLEVKDHSLRRTAQPSTLLWTSDVPKEQSELFWRLALPVTAPIMMLFMVPLCRVNQRQQRTGKVFIALLLILFYYNSITLARGWVEQQALGVWEAFGLVHGIFACIGLLLLIPPLQWIAWRKQFSKKS